MSTLIEPFSHLFRAGPDLLILSYFQFKYVLEWNANPILISVETTEFPVENISFPTVTVCREDNEPNCFEFLTKMADYIKFPCFDNG